MEGRTRLGFDAAFGEKAVDRSFVAGRLGESQRDSIFQPRVARHELPWEWFSR